MKINKYLFLAILIAMPISCKNDHKLASRQSLDYSDTFNWASFPTSIVKNVDVFYVYPTLFGGQGTMNMDIAADNMRKFVQAVIPKQASVFKDDCNIYVPYYRQMSMDGLSMSADERSKYFSVGLADVEQAFDYYLANLNNGRPFILAGHSQGSDVLLQMMKSKFENADLMNKMVAAYLIGYSVTDEDLAECDWLKIAESADDTGVIITYNTQSEFASGSPVLLPNANCVNPLNWKRTLEYAPKELNLGAVFFKDNGEIDSTVLHFTDAWIDENGALVAGTPDVKTYSSIIFPAGVYHKLDYSFFYNNLRENVGVRIKNYFSR